MFCHLVTLWLPRWFSAKIFACDCPSSKKIFWNNFDGWKTQQRHTVPALFLYLPWFLSYLQRCPKTKKLTHYKTLALGFTKKMWQLDIAFKIWCFFFTFFWLNITRMTFWSHLLASASFRNKTWRQIRYLGQNITNLQISTFDANVTPGMRKKDIL